MAYSKHTWKCGEKLTISKLNHIEEGIANSSGSGNEPFFVRYSYHSNDRSYYDKTWQEVYDAYIKGIPVIVVSTGDPLATEQNIDIAVWQATEVTQDRSDTSADMQGAIYHVSNMAVHLAELRAFNADDALYSITLPDLG